MTGLGLLHNSVLDLVRNHSRKLIRGFWISAQGLDCSRISGLVVEGELRAMMESRARGANR